MQVYKFSCNYDETDWHRYVHARSIEDAYSKLDDFDRSCAEYVEIEKDLYKIEGDNQFTFVDLSEELPF